MAERPAKRPRRIDSSAMWDASEKDSRPIERGMDGKEDQTRGDHRGERRPRSRSRDRDDRRRERSRSRERRRSRDYARDDRRNMDRDGRRGARSRDRSTSRDRQYSRRDQGHKSSRYHEGSRATRSISRSRSPTRNGRGVRTRSPPRGPKSARRDGGKPSKHLDDSGGFNGVPDSKRYPTKSNGVDDMDDDTNLDSQDIDQAIMKTMGFSTFKSTQNTKVPGNNVSGVRKEKKTQYRQYMNRTGGFNRPLSPSR